MPSEERGRGQNSRWRLSGGDLLNFIFSAYGASVSAAFLVDSRSFILFTHASQASLVSITGWIDIEISAVSGRYSFGFRIGVPFSLSVTAAGGDFGCLGFFLVGMASFPRTGRRRCDDEDVPGSPRSTRWPGGMRRCQYWKGREQMLRRFPTG